MVSGKVISKEKQEVVDFATVYLKGTTYGCTTNEEGIYHLHAPAGKYMGHRTKRFFQWSGKMGERF